VSYTVHRTREIKIPLNFIFWICTSNHIWKHISPTYLWNTRVPLRFLQSQRLKLVQKKNFWEGPEKPQIQGGNRTKKSYENIWLMIYQLSADKCDERSSKAGNYTQEKPNNKTTEPDLKMLHKNEWLFLKALSITALKTLNFSDT